jgi:hypothetical protein
MQGVAINNIKFHGIGHNCSKRSSLQRVFYFRAIFFSDVTTNQREKKSNNLNQKSELSLKINCISAGNVETYTQRPGLIKISNSEGDRVIFETEN